MKIAEAEKYVKDELKNVYEETEAANIADMVMEHISSLPKADRVLRSDFLLSSEQSDQLRIYVRKLQQHEPVQYVLNKCWFYGMELYVDKNVLIPRPETEELVHWILQDVKTSGKNVFEKMSIQADDTTGLKILDVGTGSGCIALALKKEMPKAEVWGCDVSDEALNVARRNGSDLNIRVDFQGVNFLDLSQQKSLPTVDIVVSNPPYIPQKDKEQMRSNVIDHEPHTALFVPDNDALIFYKAVSQFGKHRLYKKGCIYMEIHEALGKQVIDLFRAEGYSNIELRKDMQGKDRMVKCEM